VKLCIAGSRTIKDLDVVTKAVQQSGFSPTCIISGTASGVDKLGEEYAELHGLKLMLYPADWNRHGKAAGYIRNTQMAKESDAVICIWDGESKGTMHMINICRKMQKPLLVVNLKEKT
jgi:hypothetical protein